MIHYSHALRAYLALERIAIEADRDDVDGFGTFIRDHISPFWDALSESEREYLSARRGPTHDHVNDARVLLGVHAGPLLLLVEDLEHKARYLGSIAREEGFSVKRVSTLGEARGALEELQVKVVLLDWSFPVRENHPPKQGIGAALIQHIEVPYAVTSGSPRPSGWLGSSWFQVDTSYTGTPISAWLRNRFEELRKDQPNANG